MKKRPSFCSLVTLVIAGLGIGRSPMASGETVCYSGMSDASAVVALDGGRFMVADDEKNVLHIYSTARPGPPLQSLPWDIPLGIRSDDEHPEVDIEGATMLDGHVYWISSHGRSKKGKWRPNRHRLFAMTVSTSHGKTVATPFGTACRNLVVQMVSSPALRGLGLERALAAGEREIKGLAPKKQGLNIEGLCAAADGQSLLIGFRNPRPGGKALLVPLKNPADVLAKSARPRFGRPVQLDLRVRRGDTIVELGIRSIEYSPRHKAYLIVAGPHDGERVFGVFSWSGVPSERATLLREATVAVNQNATPDSEAAFNPEALSVRETEDCIQLLSDDGTLKVKVQSPAECEPGEYEDGWCEAKHLLDASRKTFRSLSVPLKR